MVQPIRAISLPRSDPGQNPSRIKANRTLVLVDENQHLNHGYENAQEYRTSETECPVESGNRFKALEIHDLRLRHMTSQIGNNEKRDFVRINLQTAGPMGWIKKCKIATL
jgi:hypothetical protein